MISPNTLENIIEKKGQKEGGKVGEFESE